MPDPVSLHPELPLVVETREGQRPLPFRVRRIVCGGYSSRDRREVERHCPDGRCLPLHPVPGPAPDAPDEVPAVLREELSVREDKRSPLVTLLAALAGLAGGAAANWKRNG